MARIRPIQQIHQLGVFLGVLGVVLQLPKNPHDITNTNYYIAKKKNQKKKHS